MNITEFRECVEYNIDHNIKHAILGLGAPGVGKSQIIRQIGKKYGFKVIDVRLAQMSEVEIGGLIYPNAERTKTVWLSPEILPDEKRDGKNTILLLDEITSCTKRVQVAAYQLILDRRIGQYTLPEGCFVVALGNREDDDGVYIQLAGPLADRFEIHYIDVDFNSWKNDYALKYGVHPWVVNFLSYKPDALHNQVPGDSNMVFATPRSWDRVSDILKFDSNVENRVIRNKIIGNVGQTVGNQFIDYCKHQKELVSAEDFLSGKAKAPTSPDALKILVNGLVFGCNFLVNVKSEEELTEQQRTLLDKTLKAIFRLSGEYIVIGLKELLEMNRPVVKTAFLELDDPNILTFIRQQRYALGLSDDEAGELIKKKSKHWLAMWGND